jgi:hypothetical protein
LRRFSEPLPLEADSRHAGQKNAARNANAARHRQTPVEQIVNGTRIEIPDGSRREPREPAHRRIQGSYALVPDVCRHTLDRRGWLAHQDDGVADPDDRPKVAERPAELT